MGWNAFKEAASEDIKHEVSNDDGDCQDSIKIFGKNYPCTKTHGYGGFSSTEHQSVVMSDTGKAVIMTWL